MDIVFENSTYCNQSCFFCPQYKFRMRNQIMPTEGFKDILDLIVCSVKVDLINFSGMGEPLTDVGLVEKLKYARRCCSQVTFYTNGRLLTEEILREIEPYVTRVFLSVQGDTLEEYEEYSGYHFSKILHTVDCARAILDERLWVINHPNGAMSDILGTVAAPHPIHNWGDGEIEKRTGSTLQGCNYPCSFNALKVRVDGSITLCGQDWNMENDFLNENFPACGHCQHSGVLQALRNSDQWVQFKQLLVGIDKAINGDTP